MNPVDGTAVRQKEQNARQFPETTPNDSVTKTGRPVDTLDQIQRIRRVLLLDDRREEFKQDGNLRVGAEREDQDHHREPDISAPRSDDEEGGEHLSSPLQSLRISNVGGMESLHPSWTRRTDVELEVEKLALQVQSLVHQLTTCRQNLVKAEREVSMLHQDNMKLRSLLHDVLETFAKS